MIEIGLIIAVLLAYFLLIYSTRLNFIAVLAVVFVSFFTVVYRIPNLVIFSNINFELLFNSALWGLFLYFWIYTLEVIKVSKVGTDVKNFINFLVPSKHFIFFAIFFISQLMIGKFLISFIIYYTLAKLVDIKSNEAVIIVFLGTITSFVTRLLETIYISGEFTARDINTIQTFNDNILLIMYIAAFVIMFLMHSFESSRQEFYSQNALVFGLITTVFTCTYLMTTSILSLGIAVSIAVLVSFVLTVYLAHHKRFKQAIELTEVDDDHLYFASVIIVFTYIIIGVLSSFTVLLALILLLITLGQLRNNYNYNLDLAQPRYDLLFIIFCFVMLGSYINSGLAVSSTNNFDYGTSITQSLANGINSSNDGFFVLLNFVAFGIFMPFIDGLFLVGNVTSLSYSLLTNFFYSIFSLFAFYNIYFIFSYAKIGSKNTTSTIAVISGYVFVVTMLAIVLLFFMKGVAWFI